MPSYAMPDVIIFIGADRFLQAVLHKPHSVMTSDYQHILIVKYVI